MIYSGFRFFYISPFDLFFIFRSRESAKLEFQQDNRSEKMRNEKLEYRYAQKCKCRNYYVCRAKIVFLRNP